jgi:TRAP-type C4-dicarboxylate transport system permease small subunit
MTMPGILFPGIVLGGYMGIITLIIKKNVIWANTVAEVILVLMMMITVIDVALRTVGTPIVGTYELVAMMGAMVVGFAIAKTSWDRGHVYVDMLIENRSEAVKNAFFICTRIFGIIIYALISWNLVKKGVLFHRSEQVSMTLRLPYYPAAFALAFCFFVQCLSLLGDILRINENKEQVLENHHE